MPAVPEESKAQQSSRGFSLLIRVGEACFRPIRGHRSISNAAEVKKLGRPRRWRGAGPEVGNPESLHSSACFKSSIKSSLSSNPMETRTVPGLTPARFSSSSLML